MSAEMSAASSSSVRTRNGFAASAGVAFGSFFFFFGSSAFFSGSSGFFSGSSFFGSSFRISLNCTGRTSPAGFVNTTTRDPGPLAVGSGGGGVGLATGGFTAGYLAHCVGEGVVWAWPPAATAASTSKLVAVAPAVARHAVVGRLLSDRDVMRMALLD